jgi:hypothetical protein
VDRRRSTLWALLLIAVGVVLLMREADVIPTDVAWWPLILFGIGLWLLIERLITGDRDDFVLPLVLIAIGVIFFLQEGDLVGSDVALWPIVLIAIGIGVVLSAFPLGRHSPSGERVSVTLGDATVGRVHVKHGAGRLWVRSTHDPAVLVEGTFAGGVDASERRTGGELEVTLERRNRIQWGARGGLDWEVGLSRQVPIALQVDAGANSSELDLSDLILPELRLNTGASDTTMTMPASGRTRAFVKCGAAGVRIRIPERTPARIVARAGFATVRVDETRFPRVADGFRSNDFDESGDGVDLTIDGGAASIEVR